MTDSLEEPAARLAACALAALAVGLLAAACEPRIDPRRVSGILA